MTHALTARTLYWGDYRYRTVGLEPPFWRALERMAAREKLSLSALVRRIAAERPGPSLPRELRLLALEDAEARAALAEERAAA